MTDEHLPDLALLRSFLAIAGGANLSVVAKQNSVSQPAISLQLQRLETFVGLPLVDRSSRPFRLTAEGAALAQDLPALLGGIAALIDNVRAMPERQRQTLRIVMPDSVSGVLGAEFLSAASSLARSVELRSGISPWIEEAFRSRAFDLALDSPPFDPATLANTIPVIEDPFVLISPRRLHGLSPAEFILREPQVAYARTSKFGTRAAAIARAMGATAPSRFSFDSSQSLLRFVQAGYGWAVTSVLCILQSPGALRDIDMHSCAPGDVRSLMLLNRNSETRDLAVEAAKRLAAVFRQLVDGPWQHLSPEASARLRAVNPSVFSAASDATATA
ncbi:MAG: LysR family transcriptional regulator [Albidovulum sp.]